MIQKPIGIEFNHFRVAVVFPHKVNSGKVEYVLQVLILIFNQNFCESVFFPNSLFGKLLQVMIAVLVEKALNLQWFNRFCRRAASSDPTYVEKA